MKSDLEKKLQAKRDSAEVLIRAEHGEEALEILCGFTELECIADVKLKGGWIRYALIEGGEGENDDALRRIG